MRVIAIASEKGGTGKTTTAVNLAVAADKKGQWSFVFDLDPRAIAAVWGDNRGGLAKPPPVVAAQAPRLPRQLEDVRKQGARYVFIDTPGNDNGIAKAACKVADIILIPARPHPIDLVAIVPTVEAALATKKPAYVLLNAAPVQGSEVTESIKAIEAKGVKVCPVVIYHRKAHTSQFHLGLTAFEAEPGSKATAETEALFAWLCGVSHGGH